MRPHIGWMVSEKNNKGIAEKIQNSMEIIRVDRIPEELKEIEHLEDLTLEFTNDIVIPEWMDTVKIDYLTLKGNITPELVENLKKRFYDREVNVHETNVTISVKE